MARFALFLFLALQSVSSLPAHGAVEKAPERSALAESCLAEMPSQPPTDCVSAARTIKSLLPMVSALLISDDSRGVADVFDAMEDLVQASPEDVRPLLAPVLSECARASVYLGDVATACRRLEEAHVLVMKMHDELEAERRALSVDGEPPSTPEQVCRLSIGVGSVHASLSAWRWTAEKLREKEISENQRESIARMFGDLGPLIDPYAALVRELE